MYARHGLLALLAVLLLGATARAEEVEAPPLFLDLARDYRPEDRDRLPVLRARLGREIPDLLLRPLPRCPLRSALAKALAPEEVRTELAAVRESAERTAILIDNLAARPDLASLVLESGAVDPLVPTYAGILVNVAANALLDGDGRLAARLLAGPGMEKTAERLCELAHSEGLRFLADVVIGTVAIPAEARAHLALFRPTYQYGHPTKPLGAPRVKALARVAATDPDHAMRALAALVLLRANDPKHVAATVRAFIDARSIRLTHVDWHDLGKLARAPVSDARVSIWHRRMMLESWLLWTFDRAERDPLFVEARIRELRSVLARAEPRFRGETILYLLDHAGVLVTTTHGRQRPVPSFAAILEDLVAGRPDDPPELTALGREVAARIEAELSEEDGWPDVRVREVPLASETAWRPGQRGTETALLGVVDRIRSVEEFAAALALVADLRLPPDARLRLFVELERIASFGPETEEDEESPVDPRTFETLTSWVAGTAPGLDAGLPEAILEAFGSGWHPEDVEDAEQRRREAFDRAVDRVPAGGARIRLLAMRERRRSGR